MIWLVLPCEQAFNTLGGWSVKCVWTHQFSHQLPGGAKFGRGEKLFGQISKASLVPNISFNFKDSLCHIEPEGAITTPFFFHYDMHTLMLQFC